MENQSSARVPSTQVDTTAAEGETEQSALEEGDDKDEDEPEGALGGPIRVLGGEEDVSGKRGDRERRGCFDMQQRQRATTEAYSFR